MDSYHINIAGFGIDDKYLNTLNTLNLNNMEIIKKGDIWNKRTGKKHTDNIIRICTTTTYEDGIKPAVDFLIKQIKKNKQISLLLSKCESVELQIWISYGNEVLIPNIHISREQLSYLAKIGTNIDVSIHP